MMRKTAWLFLLSLWAAIGHAELQYIPVVAFGQGVSKTDAVKAAQIQAIGQVSGELIAARTAVDKTSKEVKGEAATRTREISSSTDSLIRGAIKSTRVIRVEMNAAGLYEAEIEAQVVRVAQSAQLSRRRIAVLLSGAESGGLGELVRTAAESGLVASRKMAVLDRQQSSALESEVKLMLSDRVPVEERLKVMNLPTADLLALIAVDGLTEGRNALNEPYSELSAKVSVIDVASRQIKFAKTIKTLYPGNPQAAAGRSGKMSGERIARAILDFAYPIIVVSASDGIVVVSGGSSQLKVGQSVTFYRLGKVLKDPYTDERVGQDESEAGSGEIVGVEAALARVSSDGFTWKKGTDYVVKVTDQHTSRPGGKTASESDW